MESKPRRAAGVLTGIGVFLFLCASGLWIAHARKTVEASSSNGAGLKLKHAIFRNQSSRKVGVASKRQLTTAEQQVGAGMLAALQTRTPITGTLPQPLSSNGRKFPAPSEPQLSEAQRKVLRKLKWGPVKELLFRGDVEDGTVRTLSSPALAIGSPGGPDQAAETVLNFAQTNKELFLLKEPMKELSLASVDALADGGYVVRLKQYYQGLEVWPSEMVGNVSANGTLTTIMGSYISTPVIPSTQPAVDQAHAVAIAQSDANIPSTIKDLTAEASLVIFGEKGHVPELAYRVTLEALDLRRSTFVSAASGKVLLTYSEICEAAAAGSGVDLLGVTRALNVSTSGAIYVLRDTSKSMYSMTTGKGTIAIFDAVETYATSPSIASSSALNGGFTPAAVSAAYNLGKVYDFYVTALARSSFDGNGADIVAFVRMRDKDGTILNNAYWSGTDRRLVFGSGDRYAASLDVVAHEFTHAVTQSTANLIYQGESGALNESMSDVMGEACERYTTGTVDWVSGTSLVRPGRNLRDPSLFGQPALMSQYVSTTSDNGGVHINSGIPNHVFYLLAEGLDGGGIGVSPARNIFYHALRTKLTSRASFYDLRAGCILAASELYGQGSAEAQKTAQAFDAAEIYDSTSAGVPQDLTPVAGADSYLVVYKAVDGNYYLGRNEAAKGDGSSLTPLSTRAVNTSTRVSFTADGSTAVFVSAAHDLIAVGTDGSFESPAGSPGYFNSVSISADGKYVGSIPRDPSTGLPTNSLIYVNRSTGAIQIIDLLAPAIDGSSGVALTSVDEVDLSPDGQIALFDGLASAILGDGTVVRGWSIFAVDLETHSIYSLAGPYSGVDIGNPSFGRLSADRVLLEMESPSSSSVIAANLRAGTLATVRSFIPNSSYYAYPRYSAADDFVMFSESYFDLLSLSSQPRVSRISLLSDKISPVGSSSVVKNLAQSGVSYRRGTFAGPPVLAVSALTSSLMRNQSTAFRISRLTGDQAIRIPVSFKATGAARPSLDYHPLSLSVNLPAGATYVDVPISATAAPGPGTRTVTVTLDRATHYLISGSGQATIAISGLPEITGAPKSQVAVEGTTVVFSVQVNGGESYQWYRNGAAISGATSASYAIAAVSTSAAGSYSVRITNAAGAITSAAASLTVNPATYLSNLSVRTAMSAQQNLIVGFVVSGGSKPVLIRAAGPALNATFDLTGYLANPKITLFAASGDTLSANDDWSTSLATTFDQLGAFPFVPGSKDAALLHTVASANTAHAPAATAGTQLVEVYDADANNGVKLVNVSARNHCGTGDNILIAGFVIAGEGKRTVLIRGIGPGLIHTFDLQGVLADPKLTLFRGGDVVTSNDSWDGSLATTFATLGAFELEPGSKDAALLVELDAGAYTVQVSGADGGTGEALVEIYDANP